jgi:hypothetical protein
VPMPFRRISGAVWDSIGPNVAFKMPYTSQYTTLPVAVAASFPIDPL